MLWWLAQNAILAGILAVLVAVVCRVGRFRPAVRHALWLIVLLKLVTPPLLAWPGVALTVATEPEPQAPLALPDEPSQTFEIFAPMTIDAIISLVPSDTPAAGGESNPPLSTPAAPEPTPSASLAWQWPDWLAPVAGNVILLGAAAMALVQLVRVHRFRHMLSRGRPAPLVLRAEIKHFAARLGVHPPSIYVLPDIASPLVCGFVRPLLLWPESLSDSLSSQCQQAVIVHELAHLRRRDHWVAWLRTLAGCLWWWNPVYWYVTRQLGRNAELACDAWVIGALPNARRAYAEALLAVAGRMSKTTVPAPALGMRGSRRDFERRLIMIMRDSVPCKAPILGLVAIGVLALAVLPGLSLSQQADKPPKIVEPQQQKQPANPAQAQPNVPFIVDVVENAESFVL